MFFLLTVLNVCFVTSVLSGIIQHHEDYNLTIRLPGVVSHEPDSLICTGRKLNPEESYMVAFNPHASKETAHHMMVYGCNLPGSFEESWHCNERLDLSGICKEDVDPETLFAWALDAPEKKLPKGVGLRVSGTTKINYVVIQLHFKHAFKEGETDNSGLTIQMTNRRPPMQAGYYVMATSGQIPPQRKEVHIETACMYEQNYTIYPIGFRTHAHNLGVVTSGYRIRGTEWLEIGRMSPQLPQTFYPVSNPGMDIQPGDILASRCTMNSMSRTKPTIFGARNRDEMCNFYIMFSTSHQDNLNAQFCVSQAPQFQWSKSLSEFAPFPANASSLEGIPHKDRVLAKFS